MGLRSVAEAVFKDALLAADPEEAVGRYFELRGEVLKVGDVDYFLSKFANIYVLGAGKASVRMANAIERILGDYVKGGLVITSRGNSAPLKKTLVREAGHPLPDEDGLRSTEEMLELVGPLTDHDLVICLVSGGGSALLSAPVEGIGISDLQRLNRLFLSSGMDIEEINTVRKHISRIKGGRLAERVYPATVISLILSDVIGDRLDLIASGPTAPDPSTFQDAKDVLARRNLEDKIPDSVKDALQKGLQNDAAETPDKSSDIFRKVQNQIVGSNALSLEAAEIRAHRQGMNSMILSSSVCGESREIARFYGALAREISQHRRPLKPPACLIAGGETTVSLSGDGKGGRCQELALAMAMEIQQVPGAVFLAAGTDGIDGNSDAAGAVVDSKTVSRGREMKMDPLEYLKNNDSNSYLAPLGDLVVTGSTGTNVMDVHILLLG